VAAGAGTRGLHVDRVRASPGAARIFAAGSAPDRALAALAALAAVPAVIYAEQMAGNRRAGLPGDNTLGFEHWTVQSALPLCLVLLVALSAFRTEGCRIPAASAALGAVIFGAVAIMAGDVAGGIGAGWAAAAIAWGALVGLASILRAPGSAAGPVDAE
jgi:hypothetical protein